MKRCMLLLMPVTLWPVPWTGVHEKRDYLRHAADSVTACVSVLSDFSWIPYPSYVDREGWKAFLGEFREGCVREGETIVQDDLHPVKAQYPPLYRQNMKIWNCRHM